MHTKSNNKLTTIKKTSLAALKLLFCKHEHYAREIQCWKPSQAEQNRIPSQATIIVTSILYGADKWCLCTYLSEKKFIRNLL